MQYDWFGEDKPAVNRVDGPERWIYESQVWDDYPSSVHKFNQMRPGIVQGLISKPVPPYAALAINSSIVTCMVKPVPLQKQHT
jgi:hypothetical protein